MNGMTIGNQNASLVYIFTLIKRNWENYIILIRLIFHQFTPQDINQNGEITRAKLH